MRLNKTLLLLIFFFVNQIEAALFDDYLATKLDKRVDPCDDFYSHVCRYYGYVNNLHKKYFHEFLELRMEFLNVMAEDTVIRDIQNYMISHASFTSKLDYKEIVQLLQVDIFSNLESQVKYVSSLADPLRLMFPSVLESLAVHDADRKSQDEMKADIVRIVNFIDKSTFEDCAAEYITMIMRPSLQMYFDEEFGDDQKLKEETFLRINTTFFGIQERLLQRIERSSSLIKKKEFVKRAVRSSYPVMDFDKAIQKPREFTLIAYRIRSQYQKDVSMSPNLSWLQRKIALLRATYKFGHSFNGDKMNMEAILSASWTNPTNVELVFSQTTRQGMVIIPAGAILAAKDMDDTELMGFLGSRMGHAIAHTAIQYNVVASSRHPELRERIWAIRRHYRFICDMFPEEPCSSFSEKDDLADFEGLFDIEEWFFEEEESKQETSYGIAPCGVVTFRRDWFASMRPFPLIDTFEKRFIVKLAQNYFLRRTDFARSSDNQIIEVGGACDLPKHLGAITVEVNARFNDGVMVEAPHQTGDGTLRESTQGNNRPKADSSSRRRARRALRTAVFSTCGGVEDCNASPWT